jgi:hypothetical protein
VHRREAGVVSGEELRRQVSHREAEARALKATRLTQVLEDLGATAETVARLPERGWTMVAQLAGTRMPSLTTRALVVDMLRARAQRPCG